MPQTSGSGWKKTRDGVARLRRRTWRRRSVPPRPGETRVVVPPERWYTSRQPYRCRAATSESAVSKKTAEPSGEIASKITCNEPFPPAGPVDISVVTPLKRSYRSWVVSVSPDTRLLGGAEEDPRAVGRVRRLNDALKAPFPPLGPVVSKRRRRRPSAHRCPSACRCPRRRAASLLWKKTRVAVGRRPPELAADGAVAAVRAGGDHPVVLWLPHALRARREARRRAVPASAPVLPSSILPQSRRGAQAPFY